MNKPNFICIGAAKAGTTTLYDVLREHPQIYLPPVKETHFFDDTKYWEKGAKWYFDEYFSNVQNEIAVGEMTPSYVFFEEVPSRIAETLGTNIKLILMLRNPVTRAISHYKMHISRGNETLPLSQAFEAEPERLKSDDYQIRARHSYWSRGYYSEQIQRWWDIFSKENIHIVLFEDYLKDKNAIYEGIQDFLGVEHANLEVERKSNFGGVPRSKLINHILYRSKFVQKLSKAIVPSETARKTVKKWLAAKNLKEGKMQMTLDLSEKEIYEKYYVEEVAKLEQLLGRDLSLWKYE